MPSARLGAPAAPRVRARRHDIDCLRVVGMAAVFAVHLALVFVPWTSWHVQSAARSAWAGQVALALAPWVMPLFMLLAGESAWYALRKRHRLAFAAERTRHVLVPLLVGIPILVAPQVYLERRLAGDFDGSLLAFYGRFLDGVYPRGNFAWHHLWFLGYLFAFSLAALPLFRALRGARGRRLVARAAGLAARPAGLLVLAIPVVVVRVALSESVAIWFGATADWHNRTLLPQAFVLGYVFAADERFVHALVRHRWTLAAIALGTTAGFAAYAWRGDPVARLPDAGTPASALFWAGYALAGWGWVLALVGLARRHVVRGGRALQAASDAVYAFYLVHQPVLVAVAFVIVQRRLALPTQAAVIGVGALAISVLLAAAVGARVGRTLLGATLHVGRSPGAPGGRAGASGRVLGGRTSVGSPREPSVPDPPTRRRRVGVRHRDDGAATGRAEVTRRAPP